MAVQPDAFVTTLETMRERARRLEQEAAALRSDLDEIAVWFEWETAHSVSSDALQKTPVTELEVEAYRKRLGGQYADNLLRLVLQAQKIATHLKKLVRPAEREAAISAVIQALNQSAAALGLSIPTELEVVIGD